MEHQKIEAHPEEVSAVSSVHQVFAEKGVEEPEQEEDMLAGVKADLVSFLCLASLGNALMTGAVENYKGYLRARRGSERSPRDRNGRRASLPCYLAFNRLSRL